MLYTTDGEYTDSNADVLLIALAQYAKAFAGDHDPNLTVKDLVDDLVESADRANTPRFENHRDVIFEALNA